MSNSFIKSLPWLAPTVAVLTVGSGFLDRINILFDGGKPESVQASGGDAVQASGAAISALAVVEPLDITTPVVVEAPANASDQLAILLNASSGAQGDVDVTRSAGFSLDTLEQTRDVAIGTEPVAQQPASVGADFFAAAQANLARDTQCIDELRILAAQARVYFPSGGVTGAQEGIGQARILGLLAQQCPGVTIRVEGHSDPSGDPVINQRLSVERAEAVVTRVAASGVDSSVFDVVGRGDTVPSLVGGPQPRAYYDRRVEFSVVETAQQANFAGLPLGSAGTQFSTVACVSQLQAAVQGASIEYTPRGMTTSDADFALASQLASIATNCPEARLRMVGQHSAKPFAGENSETGRLRVTVLMANLVAAGFPAGQLIMGAPSDARPIEGLSDSRVDFDVILEDL